MSLSTATFLHHVQLVGIAWGVYKRSDAKKKKGIRGRATGSSSCQWVPALGFWADQTQAANSGKGAKRDGEKKRYRKLSDSV